MSWIWLVVDGDELRFVPGEEPEPEGALRADHQVGEDLGRSVVVEERVEAVGGGVLPRELAPDAGGQGRVGTHLVPQAEKAPVDVAENPFARIFRARVLQVGSGILGRVAPPTGPGIARYGGGAPWPWDRFG